MSRPADWSPLAGADPVPGDPEVVHAVAKRCRDAAVEIAEQAANLRRLARADGWIAEAAGPFREQATSTADKLDQAHGRYAAVASSLTSYEPVLREAQRDSLAALEQARTAQEQARRAAAQAPTGTLPADATDEQREARRLQQQGSDWTQAAADAGMSHARTLLDRAEADRDQAAGRARDAILEVVNHDGLKDSRWEKFKHWVHDNAGWISKISEIASWVATGLMIVALFIPGVNLIALAALALTLVSLAGHSMLAASGEGSWIDVGFDVLALATLGAGKVLGRGAKAAQTANRAQAARAATSSARSAALAGSSAERTALGRVLASRTSSAAARRGARAEIAALKAAARRAGQSGGRAVTRAPLPGATALERLALGGGEDEIARTVLDARNLAGRFAHVPDVVRSAGAASSAANRARAAYGAGIAVDGIDKSGVATGAKESPRFRHEVGGRW